ncbi:transmembrane protein 18 isoform X1 [Rhipicephalus microplus]|uniref:transmembrane protein 18 isoform X1 n=1 Tax=Rhipicephalus microplus TaxID=6941 RepID=UPI0018892E53|nr:transmembrane protein 18-like [Rhipicephalus microplus]
MASVERFSDTMVFPGDTLNIGSLIFQVDWTEPWLMCLVTFHIATFSLTLLTRDRGNVQAVLFMIALLLVYFSEALNDLAARHWQAFSSQQYFDSQGMFISLVFSTPLLLNCIIMVGQWMWTSGTLMIRIKQAQLREEMRRQRSANSSHSKGSKDD